jgi:hypothetical protein
MRFESKLEVGLCLQGPSFRHAIELLVVCFFICFLKRILMEIKIGARPESWFILFPKRACTIERNCTVLPLAS